MYETVNLFKCWLVGIIVSTKFWIYLFCKSVPSAIIWIGNKLLLQTLETHLLKTFPTCKNWKQNCTRKLARITLHDFVPYVHLMHEYILTLMPYNFKNSAFNELMRCFIAFQSYWYILSNCMCLYFKYQKCKVHQIKNFKRRRLICIQVFIAISVISYLDFLNWIK